MTAHDQAGHAATHPDETRWDDWHRGQNTVGAHPGSAVVWVALMALLVGGFALMGASFAQDEAWLFVAGILVSGLAFVVPLALTGRRER